MAKVEIDTTSWMIFRWVIESASEPIRFARTSKARPLKRVPLARESNGASESSN